MLVQIFSFRASQHLHSTHFGPPKTTTEKHTSSISLNPHLSQGDVREISIAFLSAPSKVQRTPVCIAIVAKAKLCNYSYVYTRLLIKSARQKTVFVPAPLAAEASPLCIAIVAKAKAVQL